MNDNLGSPEIKAKLRQVATDEFNGANRDDLTVRLVRDKVEKVLGLERDFLRSKDWSNKSKAIIKTCVQELLELEEEEQKQKIGGITGDEPKSEVQAHLDEESKNTQQDVTHLSDQEIEPRNPSTIERDEDKDNDIKTASSKPSLDSSEESEEVTTKCRRDNKNSTSKRHRLVKPEPNQASSILSSGDKKKKQQLKANEDCTGNSSNLSSPSMTVTHSSDKKTGKTTTKRGKIMLSDNCINSTDVIKERNTTEPIGAEKNLNLVSLQDKKKTEAQGQLLSNEEEATNSDMSIVFDEPPLKSKRKRPDGDQCTNQKGIKRTQQQQRQEARKNTNPSKLSLDEATIKNLQSQLRKCGARKNWSSELKEYGSDTKAKIRHLKRALEAIGMKGRFSEVKAREIKEARELMADVEAVQEGAKKWGLMLKKRTDKKKYPPTRKTLEEEEEEEEDNGGDGDDNNNDNDEEEDVREKRATPSAKQETDNLTDESSLDDKRAKGEGKRKNMAKKSCSRSRSTADATRTLIRKRRSNALDWLQDEDSDE